MSSAMKIMFFGAPPRKHRESTEAEEIIYDNSRISKVAERQTAAEAPACVSTSQPMKASQVEEDVDFLVSCYEPIYNVTGSFDVHFGNSQSRSIGEY